VVDHKLNFPRRALVLMKTFFQRNRQNPVCKLSCSKLLLQLSCGLSGANIKTLRGESGDSDCFEGRICWP